MRSAALMYVSRPGLIWFSAVFRVSLTGSLRLSLSISRKCPVCSSRELRTSAWLLVLLPNPTSIADNTSARRASCIMSASR
ncbi:hypothetical protein D3C84_1195560 [compost metagenome]